MTTRIPASGVDLIGISVVCIALAACGPTTSVYNDSPSKLYVDLTPKHRPRGPYPHLVEIGDSMIVPWCSNEVANIYIGAAPNQLRVFDAAKYCSPKKCNCAISASSLMKA